MNWISDEGSHVGVQQKPKTKNLSDVMPAKWTKSWRDRTAIDPNSVFSNNFLTFDILHGSPCQLT